MLQRSSVFDLLLALLAAVCGFFRRRADTLLEILALRQQLAVLKRKRPRPAVNRLDRAFWILLRRAWSRWTDTLIIVQPDTVVRWSRGLSPVLALAVPTTRRPAESRRGNPDADPLHGS